MKNTTIPPHTKDQRRRLLLLARLLDRVPRHKFSMEQWVSRIDQLKESFVSNHPSHSPKECGYAGCAIGWGFTSPLIRADSNSHEELLASLGVQGKVWNADSTAGLLFGPHRRVTSKRVAADIRRYLKTGELPSQ